LIVHVVRFAAMSEKNLEPHSFRAPSPANEPSASRRISSDVEWNESNVSLANASSKNGLGSSPWYPPPMPFTSAVDGADPPDAVKPGSPVSSGHAGELANIGVSDGQAAAAPPPPNRTSVTSL
jgi:hypothetical protein